MSVVFSYILPVHFWIPGDTALALLLSVCTFIFLCSCVLGVVIAGRSVQPFCWVWLFIRPMIAVFGCFCTFGSGRRFLSAGPECLVLRFGISRVCWIARASLWGRAGWFGCFGTGLVHIRGTVHDSDRVITVVLIAFRWSFVSFSFFKAASLDCGWGYRFVLNWTGWFLLAEWVPTRGRSWIFWRFRSIFFKIADSSLEGTVGTEYS